MLKKLLSVALFIIAISCSENSERNFIAEDYDSGDLKEVFILYRQSGNNFELKKNLLSRAEAILAKSNNDSIKAYNLVKLSYEYYKLQDSTNFSKVNDQVLQLAEKRNDSSLIAKSYWYRGLFNQYTLSNNKDAYENYFKAKDIYDNLNDERNSGKMLLNMAIIQTNVRDFVGSENTTISAITKFENLNEFKNLYGAYNNIGIVNTALGDYENAEYYHLKALRNLENLGNNPSYRAASLNNLGVVYKDKGDYNAAIKVFEQAKNIDSLFYKNTIVYAAVLDNLGYSKFKLGEELEVLYLYRKSLGIRDSINYEPGIIESKLNLSEFYVFKNDTMRAKVYAEEAKELAEKSNNSDELLTALLRLSDLDKANAANYRSRYIALSDSLQAQERKIKNSFARIRYETDEYIDQNQELSEQIRLYTLIGFTIIILGLLLFKIYDQRAKNKRLQLEREQQLANEQIYDLMIDQQNKLTEGRKREKKRISKELHDGVLGSLFGTRLSLGSLNSSNEETAIATRQDYIERLKEIEEEIRSISHNLRSNVLKDDQIYSSLIAELLEFQSKANRFNYSLQFDESMDWDLIDSKLKINLYRILQEALQNIGKYAKAKEVLITFKLEDEVIHLIIQDDGIGFEVTKKNKGIGLLNMHSRVADLKGNINILSTPQQGTTIKVTIPKELYFDKKTA